MPPSWRLPLLWPQLDRLLPVPVNRQGSSSGPTPTTGRSSHRRQPCPWVHPPPPSQQRPAAQLLHQPRLQLLLHHSEGPRQRRQSRPGRRPGRGTQRVPSSPLPPSHRHPHRRPSRSPHLVRLLHRHQPPRLRRRRRQHHRRQARLPHQRLHPAPLIKPHWRVSSLALTPTTSTRSKTMTGSPYWTR